MTMSEFNEKYKQYESNKKKTNRNGIVLLIAGLAIFVGLFVYNIYTEKEKEKDAEIIFQYNNEQIKESEIQDSLKYVDKINRVDSLQEVIKQVQTKIVEIKNDPGINPTVRQKIDSLEVKVNTIQSIAQDTITVRYYKRFADGNNVENTIKSIKDPNFYLEYRDVPNDDSLRKVNTLYYGKNVKEFYVKLLQKRLLENQVKINDLKPYVSARGFEWKQDAIEIGFEKPSSTTEENAKFYVRIYSFKPDKKNKYSIRNKLEAKGFQVTLYPDWPEKPSFFSNESTVLYYHESNKNKAITIAKTLSDLTTQRVLKKSTPINIKSKKVISTDFAVKMGGGYGVSEEERKELFIVHYNGSN